MTRDDSDPVEVAAAAVGAAYGMTAEQALQHAALGDVPHPDAPPDVCGATDPRDAAYWCVLPPGHPRDAHSRYTEADMVGPHTLWHQRWADAEERRRGAAT